MSTTREERAKIKREVELEAARARFIVEHGEKTRCPNCMQPVIGHKANGCALHTLIGCIRERGEHDEHTCLNLHYKCDVDKVWDELGPLVDELERGGFNRG